MKRSIISLLVMGLFAGTATTALAADVTAENKAGDTSQSKATEQNSMPSPGNDAQAASPAKDKHDKGTVAFLKADKDNDGTLDREEAKAMPNVAKNFDAIDADKDGTVSLSEVHTFMKARNDAANAAKN